MATTPSAGTIYTILKDVLSFFERRFAGPRLRIAYDPWRSREVLSVADAGGRRACFYHLIVSNVGRRRAHGARGALVSVEREASEGADRLRLAKPETLKWANELTYSKVDIPKGEDRRLDLAFVFEDDPHLFFFFQPASVPIGTRQTFPPGHYVAKVRVDFDHGSAVARLRIHHPGVWTAVEIQVLE